MLLKKISLDKFKANYFNALKWSNYKHKAFKECKRKFLYKYGRALINTAEIEEVEKLKKLKNLSNWVGEKIHNFIDIYINTESLSNVLAMLKNVFQVTFRNRSSEIFEFFYEVSVSANEEKEFYERSERALKNFDYYYKQNLKKLKNNIISRDSQGIQSFILDGITVLYKPDLVVKVDDNISIFDWKTFDATSDLNQVDLYILAFHSKGFSNIEFKIVNLSNVNEEVFYTDSERLLKYKEFIKSSFEEIKNFWDELQIFTQKEFDNLFEQIYNNFPKTNDYNLCKRCEFKKLCQR